MMTLCEMLVQDGTNAINFGKGLGIGPVYAKITVENIGDLVCIVYPDNTHAFTWYDFAKEDEFYDKHGAIYNGETIYSTTTNQNEIITGKSKNVDEILEKHFTGNNFSISDWEFMDCCW